MVPSIRIIVLGTGDFALPTFEHLVETGCRVVALVTQPDRPQGRKQELVPSLIKQSAEARGIPIEQPEDVNAPESLNRLRDFKPDLLVTAAYGQILSAELLSIPRLGGINLHGSILPSYRGAAPVARAIQNGETETGVTVIRMTPRIDAGGIVATAVTTIGPDETAGELEERLARSGAPLVAQAVAALAAGPVAVLPQDKAKVTPSSEASQGRRSDRLVAAGLGDPQSGARDATLAGGIHHLAASVPRARRSPAGDRPQDRGHRRPGCAGRSDRSRGRPAGRRRGRRSRRVCGRSSSRAREPSPPPSSSAATESSRAIVWAGEIRKRAIESETAGTRPAPRGQRQTLFRGAGLLPAASIGIPLKSRNFGASQSLAGRFDCPIGDDNRRGATHRGSEGEDGPCGFRGLCWGLVWRSFWA